MRNMVVVIKREREREQGRCTRTKSQQCWMEQTRRRLAVGAEEMEHVIIWHVPFWNGSFAGGQVGSFGFVSSKSGCDEDGRRREMR